MKFQLILKMLLFASTLLPIISLADFMPLSYSTDVDFTHENVSFSITFSEVPDFFTVDQFNRQANAFELVVDNSHSTNPWENGQKAITGNSIYSSHPNLEVLDRSSGWSVAGETPYLLSSNMVTFTTSWALIGIDDGDFSYHLTTTEYGAAQWWTNYAESGISYSVPEPNSAALLFVGISILCIRRKIFSNQRVDLTR